ncbi:MAG TPA: alpha-2-macroglobulin family protein [Pantanalinema sp.]
MNLRRVLTWLVILVVGLFGATGVGIIASEAPAGSVTGVVRDAAGKALPNARIHFMGPIIRTAIAQADGTFRMDRLPVGQYNVQARARGFDSQWSSPAIQVEEDRTVENVRFALAPRDPNVYFAHHQRVFTPKEKVRLGLRGTLLDRLHLKLYRIDLARLSTSSNALSHLSDASPAALGASATLVREWDRTVKPQASDEDDWFYRAIEVSDISRGAYMLAVEGSGVVRGVPARRSDTYWFEVTNLSLVTKRSADSVLVYAVDLLTNKPLSGVPVRAYDDRGLRWSAATDAEGLIRRSYRGAETLLLMGELSGAPAHAQSYYYGAGEQYRAQVFTDRPIYRPSQEVAYKAIIRRAMGGENLNLPALPVTVQVIDPQENVVHQVATRTDALGALDGRLTLAEEPLLGDYRVIVLVGGERHEAGFKVQEYRKPEFKLDVRPERARHYPGETAKAVVAASYYFGAPVVGAKVHYNVFSSSYYPWASEDDAFYSGFEGAEGYDWGYRNLVSQGEAVTDAAGHVTLSVPAELGRGEDGPSDQRYTVELEAVDASRQVVRGSGTFLVTQGALTLELTPDRYVYSPGASASVSVRALDLDGKPARTKASVRLERVETLTRDEGRTYETKRTPAGSWQVSTDARGEARLSVPIPDRSGDYRLVVTAADREGRVVTATTSMWVAGESWEGESYRQGLIRLTFDRKRYRVGEVAKVLVQLPRGDVYALLSVEGQRLYHAEVLGAGQAARIVSIPITKDYRPNAFVCAAVVDGKAFLQAERSLNVSPDASFLAVTVKPGKERYLPGEEARLDVETRTLAGRPVAAEVALGVVDEAIYALSPDPTPDIRRTFHGPSWNRVTTGYSFVEDYSGGPGKDTEEPRIRKNLKDTAAWFPRIRTGADGKATVRFLLPDNLTTWVVKAQAYTASTQVGVTREKFIATKDLLVRLAMPRFLVMGDRITIAALVHNYTPEDQTVRLALAASNLKVASTWPERLSVARNGLSRLDLSVEPVAPGTASLTFKAVGTGASDALALGVPVLAHGTPERLAFTGFTEAASPSSIELVVPPDAVPETLRFDLSLTPTPLAAIGPALSYLRRYPYGCLEQTTSRFVPELRASRVLSRLGLDGFGLGAQGRKQAEEGIARIVRFQHADGGWGWFGPDESEVDLTAYALFGLREASLSGFEVPAEPVRQALAYLERQGERLGKDLVTRHEVRRGAGADALASAVWALGAWDRSAPGLRDKLYASRADLSNYGRALATLAFAESGDEGRARTFWTELAGRAVRTGTLTHWESGAAAYSWYDGATETTAYAVRAGLAVAPGSPEVQEAVRWLLTTRQGDRWQSTKDTGAIVMALSDAVRTGAAEGLPEACEVLVDGSPVERLSLAAERRYTGATLSLDAARLAPGRHVVTLRPQGKGSLPYAALLSFDARREDIPAKAGSDVAVRRDYFQLDDKTFAGWQANGALAGSSFDPKQVAKLSPIGGRVKSQAKVLVRLTLEARAPLRYMLVEDPLIAGAEVVTPQGTAGWSGMAVRDDRVVFFERELASGSHALYYVLRPELPGDYHVLPTVAEGMYAPEVRARAAETRLEIAE